MCCRFWWVIDMLDIGSWFRHDLYALEAFSLTTAQAVKEPNLNGKLHKHTHMRFFSDRNLMTIQVIKHLIDVHYCSLNFFYWIYLIGGVRWMWKRRKKARFRKNFRSTSWTRFFYFHFFFFAKYFSKSKTLYIPHSMPEKSKMYKCFFYWVY